ncbi:NUDIX domain-containing protein [Streptomyces sp. SCSIO ZS0520]|uniref:NUDIX domain-containing protein n=1 Tax=Streptomyces sp. SCSIO ZS0520 TaxID=2892996 RepID=UPI0021DA3979|nr:NUDIX domain-containing protein [Streptomyces sp. SCSIO ZS0520]
MNPAEEILDIVDARDRVLGQAPRGEVYARRLRHRCVFVLATAPDGRVFVHRRAATKMTFAGYYDMFVGGVVGTGESYEQAALREAEEELGVSGLPQPAPALKFLYEAPEDTADTARGGGETGEAGPFGWWSWVYQVPLTLPVRPQAEEIDWHGFLTEEEIDARLGDRDWTPDSLAAYALLKSWRAKERG